MPDDPIDGGGEPGDPDLDFPVTYGAMKKTSIPPRNYLAKADEFLAHWPLANTAFGSAIVLTGNYAVAQLTSDRAALLTQMNAVVTAENANQSASEARDIARAAIKERIRQFNNSIRAFWPDSVYVNQLPKMPTVRSSLGVWQKALQDVADIWAQINAITPVPAGAPIPLLLVGGYTRATFVTDQTAAMTAFTTVTSAALAAENARNLRDQIWNPMYQRLKQYRLAIQGRFAVETSIYSSLPSLAPPAGATPDAVNVSASWDLTISKAVITFSESSDPNLDQYELRACFGSRYVAAEEQVLASLMAGDSPLRFETDDGLVASGSKVFYKVYVMLTTGNEKGSRSVSVTRP